MYEGRYFISSVIGDAHARSPHKHTAEPDNILKNIMSNHEFLNLCIISYMSVREHYMGSDFSLFVEQCRQSSRIIKTL